jgi:hypothetical protein
MSSDWDAATHHPARRPGPKRVPGVGKRLAFVRVNYGSKGEDTTVHRFARELEVHPQTYRQWEGGSFPGLQRLTEAYSAHPGVRSAKTPPDLLARWVRDGKGGMPWGDKGEARALPELDHTARVAMPYRPLEADLGPDELAKLAMVMTPADLKALGRLEGGLRGVKIASLIELVDHVLKICNEGLADASVGREEAATELAKEQSRADGWRAVIRIRALLESAKKAGVVSLIFALALTSTAFADPSDSGSSTLTGVQVQVLSSALKLLLRLLRRRAKAPSGWPTPPTPPDLSLSAAGAYGKIHSLVDVVALVAQPIRPARAKKTGTG